jgi:type IV secretory pathway VirB3-like protein
MKTTKTKEKIGWTLEIIVFITALIMTFVWYSNLQIIVVFMLIHAILTITARQGKKYGY